MVDDVEYPVTSRRVGPNYWRYLRGNDFLRRNGPRVGQRPHSRAVGWPRRKNKIHMGRVMVMGRWDPLTGYGGGGRSKSLLELEGKAERRTGCCLSQRRPTSRVAPVM